MTAPQDVQDAWEAGHRAGRADERERINDGLAQLCEDSTEGLYGDYGPVMLIGEQVAALVEDRPWEGLGDDDEDDDEEDPS